MEMNLRVHRFLGHPILPTANILTSVPNNCVSCKWLAVCLPGLIVPSKFKLVPLYLIKLMFQDVVDSQGYGSSVVLAVFWGASYLYLFTFFFSPSICPLSTIVNCFLIFL